MSIDSSKVIEEHKRGDNDTGSPEVQVALLTARITSSPSTSRCTSRTTTAGAAC